LKTVSSALGRRNTPLKRGVNERRRGHPENRVVRPGSLLRLALARAAISALPFLPHEDHPPLCAGAGFAMRDCGGRGLASVRGAERKD
jgi:hypothetical protein